MSHDASETILICGFGAEETFRININVENSCLIFEETVKFVFQKVKMIFFLTLVLIIYIEPAFILCFWLEQR